MHAITEGQRVCYDGNVHDTGTIVKASFGRVAVRWDIDGEIVDHILSQNMISWLP